jgi:large subunit ribosomal protein L4
MSKINILNINGEKVKDHSLSKEVFGIVPNNAVLYDSITLIRNSLRQGTQSAKTRAEVSGGGRKPWKQKGTGRARQGSIRSPQWVGGGVVFAPKPRDYSKKMNRKERRLALRSAFSYKAQSNELIILDTFVPATSKTKDMLAILNNLKVGKKVLIIVDELNDNLVLATRNINNVSLLQVEEVSTLDILGANSIIITEEALKSVEEVFA